MFENYCILKTPKAQREISTKEVRTWIKRMGVGKWHVLGFDDL